MADVKWIKILTTIFEDEKIKLVQSMPEGDALIVIWLKLLTQAGKSNNGGYVWMNESNPYTPEMLSVIFGKSTQIVNLAMATFKQFGMICTDEYGIYISNWEKHQNIEGLEKLREYNRTAKRLERERKRLLLVDVNDKSMTVKESQCIDIDLDKDKEIDKDISKHAPSKEILNLYHSICISLPKVRQLTDARRKAINARWKENSNIEHFIELFTKTENSDFLSGRKKNDRNWKCNFDWVLNQQNSTKIIEGLYDNLDGSSPKPPTQDRKPTDNELAIQKLMKEMYPDE